MHYTQKLCEIGIRCIFLYVLSYYAKLGCALPSLVVSRFCRSRDAKIPTLVTVQPTINWPASRQTVPQ